jgi:hypothetical protein
MSELSPLSGVKRKSYFRAAKTVFDPTATSLSKRADAAGRHVLIKRVQERRNDESSIAACGAVSATAVKRSSWTASLFNAGRRVRVRSPRDQKIGDALQHRLAPLIA